MSQAKPTPETIRALRAQRPEMRERDFARIHAISEAELVAAHTGETVIRLRPDVEALLNGAKALGEVMVLTRNESAVHEKIGPFEKVGFGAKAAIALGKQIDLRIFPSKWVFGFAVEKTAEDGAIRRSLQFFDGEGTAVFKIHARPATDLPAWGQLIETLRSADQNPVLDIAPAEPAKPSGKPASREQLRDRWSQLTDTHQFFGMLRDLNLERLPALEIAGEDYAWPLSHEAVPQLFEAAAGSGLPIMVFVGSAGCVQIHSGPIETIKTMGPWLNVMDETFHLHLRVDQIASAWGVRKPVTGGHVTSVEAYDAEGRLIIQFFGKRQEGVDERTEWRSIVEALPVRSAQTAA